MAGVLVPILVIAMPLVIGTVLSVVALSASPLKSAVTVAPLVATVESGSRDDALETKVSLVAPTSVPIESQSVGVITKLNLTVGVECRPGEVVMIVDGSRIIGYRSAAPLYRDISPGAEGSDVVTAQHLLIDMGLLRSKADGKAGADTVAAIEHFNKRAKSSGPQSTLRLSSLVWIPSSSRPPDEILVRVGSRVVPGSALYTTTSQAGRLEISGPAQSYDRLLRINGNEVLVPSGETIVSDEGFVADLLSAAGTTQDFSGSLVRAQPRKVGTLPTSALVYDPSGKVCFFPDPSGEAIVVEPAPGTFGIADVSVDLVGTPVLLNPRDTREDLSCA